MAIFECKMCGGALDIQDGVTVTKCFFCGTKQTIPKLDSEKKTTLFSRANRLRFNCEFDKASGLYESIVSEFPREAEAFWGLVLCKYGIEYVDDPATAKKIPTCHRSSFESVLEDTDFEQALENADIAARAVYREEAKQIEELRQGIVEVSAKEEPYDIFICYKETDFNGERTIDSVIAQDVYTALTDKGYRVFFSRISLEDKLGKEYEPYIFAALNSAKIMLAFGTDYEYYNAVWVKNEWSRFLKLMATDRTKTLIPCYKGIDAYDMPKAFLKLQSQDMGKVGAIQDLLRGVEKILPKNKPAEVRTVVVNGAQGGADTGSLLRRAEMFLEDGDFNGANTCAEKVLDIFPESVEAYLVKLCCDYKVKNKAGLGRLSVYFTENINYKRILRFADDSLIQELNGYIAKIPENIIAARNAYEIKKRRYALASKMISAGYHHTTGVKPDGKVISVGSNYNFKKEYCGQCKVSGWSNIVTVAAGCYHTVGVKRDGKVVSVGQNDNGQCSTVLWQDIVAVDADYLHTVGLRKDGTVFATGKNTSGQCNVSDWRNIVAVSAGQDHTVGLKSDGTVVAAGSNGFRQCNVSGWQDIVAISAGCNHTIGLKSDGTVVAVGNNPWGQCNVSDWRDIIAICAGNMHTVGLKSDGTVVAVGRNENGECNVSGWRDIVAISAGNHTVGLKKDGTLVACGINDEGQCNVKDWKLFDSIDTLEEEIKLATEKCRQALLAEKTSLENELANLKGLFTGKRKKEIQENIARIEYQLKTLK